MENKSELQLVQQAELRSLLGIRFSTILEMSEQEISRLISFLENDPLFQKLFRTQDPEWKIIHRERFPSSRWTSSLYDIEEGRSPDQSSSQGVADLLENHRVIVEKIRKIGQENYEFYFLYDDGERSVPEIARELEIPEETVEEIREFTEKVLIHSDLSQSTVPGILPSTLSPELSLNYVKVSAYHAKSDGSFQIVFYSPLMARGVYKINYEKLHKLKQVGVLDKQEKKRLQDMVKWLELVNSRKKLIFRILQLLPAKQKDFFLKGDWELLISLTQRMMAHELKITPAALCRAIRNRSIVMPHGEEVPLIRLFPSRKEILKKKIAPLIEKNSRLSDRMIQRLVQEKFGVSLSRRSINVYRNEIAGLKRKKG